MTYTRRFLFSAALTALMLPSIEGQAGGANPPVVVELFTSQGCHSCPPAEDFLGDLAEREDVIALEFHVDYWDYIGWKDPFADPSYTDRQRDYNRLFASPYNYTPQMVVDGRAHEVGSRRSAVEARIEAAAMKRMMAAQDSGYPNLAVTLESDGSLSVTLAGEAPERGDFRIVVVGFDDQHETEVLRGENTGKNLVNARVVRSLEVVGPAWQGGDLALSVPADQISGQGGCAILVQNPTTGTIAIAHQMEF